MYVFPAHIPVLVLEYGRDNLIRDQLHSPAKVLHTRLAFRYTTSEPEINIMETESEKTRYVNQQGVIPIHFDQTCLYNGRLVLS